MSRPTQQIANVFHVKHIIFYPSLQHIFCEDCIGIWFDRERTCPMCRAKIAEDPQWRDGNTQSFIQFF